MELVSQNQSVPFAYLSAPTSPCDCSTNNLQFYSAPTSPREDIGFGCFRYESDARKTEEDEFEFEFETSRRVGGGWEMEQLFPTFEWNKDQEQQTYRLPARAKSFSTMAFADELFGNGQVLPLKPPPRLQTSVPTSPKSSSLVLRTPFARRCKWNDDFDPFVAALEKVTEETRGRMSVHRRSRSYSPFRTSAVSHWLDGLVGSDLQQHEQVTNPEGSSKPMGLTSAGMTERKGSMYSRWVRSQTMVKKRSTDRTKTKGLWFGRRVRDADINQEEPMRPMKRSESTSSTESKMQRVKSVLLRYASRSRETSERKTTDQMAATLKTSYFKKLRFSFKGSMKKKVSAEPNMAVIKNNHKLPRCLGYAPGTLPIMN